MKPAETDEALGTSPRSYGFNQRIPPPSKATSLRILRLTAIWEALRVALASLRSNKLRTALTLVGIIVGVSAVIAVVTIIKGLDKTVATTFSSQGSTVFTVSKRPRVITSREEFIKFNKRKDVTREDAEAIFRLCSSCWKSGMAVSSVEIVKHKDQKSDNVVIRGVAPTAMFDIDAVAIDAGRFWTESEGERAREICIVGADIVENLFRRNRTRQSGGPGSQHCRTPLSDSRSAATAGQDLRQFARQHHLHSLFDLSEELWRARLARCFCPNCFGGPIGGNPRSSTHDHAQPARTNPYRRRRRRVFSRIVGCVH